MTAPTTARCLVCGDDWPLCPDGHTLTRHHLNRWPACTRHCRGGRHTATKEN